MHIGQILQCDEGASGLEAAGIVDFASDQTHGETQRGKAWSRQFVTLAEGSDKIGVTLWNCRVIHKGERICVTSAKTEKDRDGKICLSSRTLDGSTPAPQDAPPSANDSQEVDWDAKNLRDHRGARLRDAVQLICALAEVNGKTQGLSPELAVEVAEQFVKYTYNGPQPQREPGQDDGPGF